VECAMTMRSSQIKCDGCKEPRETLSYYRPDGMGETFGLCTLCVRCICAQVTNELIRTQIAASELLVWCDNWMPDEAKDQGAREAIATVRRIVGR